MILRVTQISVIFLLSSVLANVQFMDEKNYESIIKNAQVTFVAFCADWCVFSRLLKPIFEEAAKTFATNNPDANVVWAIFDNFDQARVANFYVSKYPTMKVFINGEVTSKEYRSTRSIEALTDFVTQQLASCIREYRNKEELEELLDKNKRNIVAHFSNRDSVEHNNFQKISSVLREDCAFWINYDNSDAGDDNMMYFLDPDTNDEQKFVGDFADYNFLKQWLNDKCIPLVREVTFENVEELTEEGLPFLLYFRDTANKEDDKKFTELVMRELYDQRTAINALLADGHKFAHPLKHLGKTAEDLPVLAIDSFQHMFLFENMSQLYEPGKLRQFVLDLHSEKLHKDFHANLDQKMLDLQKLALEHPEKFADDQPLEIITSASPPPSVFKKLKPSETRYSLLYKTEL